MTRPFVAFNDVSFTYGALGQFLLEHQSVDFPPGWTGVVGPNGAGKTTVLLLATGALGPTAGSVRVTGAAIYCPQRTDDPPDGLAGFLTRPDGRAGELVGRLAIKADYHRRWPTLSHGERKRAQLAMALWRQPGVLAVDEPTNHLDAGSRALLADALGNFKGVGLLVSHDRELLDRLCDQSLFLDPPPATLRTGGYTATSAEAQREEACHRKTLDRAVRNRNKLRRERTLRREEARGRRRNDPSVGSLRRTTTPSPRSTAPSCRARTRQPAIGCASSTVGCDRPRMPWPRFG